MSQKSTSAKVPAIRVAKNSKATAGRQRLNADELKGVSGGVYMRAPEGWGDWGGWVGAIGGAIGSNWIEC